MAIYMFGKERRKKDPKNVWFGVLQQFCGSTLPLGKLSALYFWYKGKFNTTKIELFWNCNCTFHMTHKSKREWSSLVLVAGVATACTEVRVTYCRTTTYDEQQRFLNHFRVVHESSSAVQISWLLFQGCSQYVPHYRYWNHKKLSRIAVNDFHLSV